MPETTDTRHIGIFQENGSGGFVSDLSFRGGKYCWAAGSQQYTAKNIKFQNCKCVGSSLNGSLRILRLILCRTAVYMIWAWNFNFQGIDVSGGNLAINATELSSEPDRDTGQRQGTGVWI
jgi:hypothetical protein